MGFDIERFTDSNIDHEFICDLCQAVLEDPLMINPCQHIFCSKCIRDSIKIHGVCPQDRSTITISNLTEPVRIVKNLLNKLKLKCDFTSDGCQQVVTLGELLNHRQKCEYNPENKYSKCICDIEFQRREFELHKENCLRFQKNELRIAKSQLATYSSNLYPYNEELSAKVTSDSEVKFLYKRLKQSLPTFTDEYNIIQRILLYINWKLLSNEIEREKDPLTTIRYIKYAFDDLSLATNQNYDNLQHFIQLNAFEYLYLCEALFNNKLINKYMSRIFQSFNCFSDLLDQLMNRQCIELMVTLTNNEKNEINTCVDCAFVLSNITLIGSEKWQQMMPELNRQNMLNKLKTNISKWKLIQESDISFHSLTEIFSKLKSDKTTPEVNYFYIWILAHLIRKDNNKYIPIIESENGLEFLQKLFESENIETYLKRILELVINQINEWKKEIKSKNR